MKHIMGPSFFGGKVYCSEIVHNGKDLIVTEKNGSTYICTNVQAHREDIEQMLMGNASGSSTALRKRQSDSRWQAFRYGVLLYTHWMDEGYTFIDWPTLGKIYHNI